MLRPFVAPTDTMTEPRYAQIARTLAEGIADGRFAKGALLPSEAALGAQFAASRHTIREALSELVHAGLVTRRNGVGTIVEERQGDGGYDTALSSVEDLTQFAATNLRVIRRVDEIVADRDLAREIGGKPGSHWFHIASVRVSPKPQEPPVCWTDNYVLPQYSDLRQWLKDDPKALISDLIETRYGRRSVEVRQTIEATALKGEMAQELGAKPGTPALKIVRRYVDRAGEVFSTTISLHPQDRFKFSVTMRRSGRG